RSNAAAAIAAPPHACIGRRDCFEGQRDLLGDPVVPSPSFSPSVASTALVPPGSPALASVSTPSAAFGSAPAAAGLPSPLSAAAADAGALDALPEAGAAPLASRRKPDSRIRSSIFCRPW